MALSKSERRSMYDSPVTAAQEVAQHRRKAEADRLEPLHDRHRKERADMESRHHADGQKLRHEFRDVQYAVKRPNVEEKAAKARSEMDKKHDKERKELAAKHTNELRKAKGL